MWSTVQKGERFCLNCQLRIDRERYQPLKPVIVSKLYNDVSTRAGSLQKQKSSILSEYRKRQRPIHLYPYMTRLSIYILERKLKTKFNASRNIKL